MNPPSFTPVRHHVPPQGLCPLPQQTGCSGRQAQAPSPSAPRAGPAQARRLPRWLLCCPWRLAGGGQASLGWRALAPGTWGCAAVWDPLRAQGECRAVPLPPGSGAPQRSHGQEGVGQGRRSPGTRQPRARCQWSAKAIHGIALRALATATRHKPAPQWARLSDRFPRAPGRR